MHWKELINQLNPKRSKSTLFEYSPSPHLVSSNDEPTEEEHAAIQQAIYNLTQTSLAEPTEERLRALRAILSPLRRFPPELLGEIFVHCLKEQDNLRDNAPPWYLLHVSQLWRQVAMSIPKLWRHLPPMIYKSSKNTNKSPMLRFLLQLSSSARLTFLLHQLFLTDEVLPLLALHSDRWERVDLSISEGVFEYLDGFVGQLPSLTTVSITITQNFHLPPSTFLRAPNLKIVHLRGCSPWVLYSELPLPWKQLTSFTSVSPLRPDQFITIAANCRQLERLDIILPRARSHLPMLPATFSSLTYLALSTSHDRGLLPLLPVLTLPSLTELFIGSFIPPSLLNNLSALITRSGCSLQRLVIHSSFEDFDCGIIDILRLTPQLRYLDISTQTGQTFVQALCECDPVEGWTLVPHLETLLIRIVRMTYQLGQLALARCDLHHGNVHTQGCRRLRNLILVPQVPLQNLKDDMGVKVRQPSIPFHLTLQNIISASSTTLNDDRLTYLEKKKWLSKKLDKVLSVAAKMTRYVLYLYYNNEAKVTTYLWKLYSIVPSSLRQELDMKKRFEDVLMLWANAMVSSSANIRWIWDKHGHLKYIPKSADRRFLFLHFKRFFFEEPEFYLFTEPSKVSYYDNWK